MRGVALLVLAALAVLPDAANGQAPSSAAGNVDAELVARGQRIYREGILPSGAPLLGVAQAGVTRAGSDAACAACHRRSGYGSSEGSLEIRSITGPALFGDRDVRPVAPTWGTAGPRIASANGAENMRVGTTAVRARAAALYGARQRPPYDDASLRLAITAGIDITGRPMNEGMPRYALEDHELQSLIAYLKTLSAHYSPGVTTDRIHFATVIQPGVDAHKRRAMLDVLNAYIDDRNAGARSEVRREQAGSVRLGRTYREWVLHVWELNGSLDTWTSQLEAFNGQQPVFALISGLGNQSWRPIHEFSERFAVPCIFPQTDLPVVEEGGFYTMYLSKGIVLEAKVLAEFLREQGERGPIMQVFRSDDVSTAGADAFRTAWQATTGVAPEERVVSEAPDEHFWRRLSAEAAGRTVVLWLPPSDLADMRAMAPADSHVKVIYLSSAMNHAQVSAPLAYSGPRVRLVYPHELPARLQANLRAIELWLHAKGIGLADERIKANAYLAAVTTAGSMSHDMDTFSCDLLLERIEHRVGNTLDPSLYPHLSLGPGQRFASKGSYIVELASSKDEQVKPVSAWIVP